MAVSPLARSAAEIREKGKTAGSDADYIYAGLTVESDVFFSPTLRM
jgi:hypothetical protein